MAIDPRFNPPLDLPTPEGKEAEWALMRLAERCGVERKYYTWQELADAIFAAFTSTRQETACPDSTQESQPQVSSDG